MTTYKPGVLGPGGGLLQHQGGLHPVELRLPVQQSRLAGQLRPHPGQLQHVSTQPGAVANIITVHLYSCRMRIQAGVGFMALYLYCVVRPDSSGALWCYLAAAPASTTCQDARPSNRFPRNFWSYEACITPALNSLQCLGYYPSSQIQGPGYSQNQIQGPGYPSSQILQGQAGVQTGVQTPTYQQPFQQPATQTPSYQLGGQLGGQVGSTGLQQG